MRQTRLYNTRKTYRERYFVNIIEFLNNIVHGNRTFLTMRQHLYDTSSDYESLTNCSHLHPILWRVERLQPLEAAYIFEHSERLNSRHTTVCKTRAMRPPKNNLREP